MKSLSRLKRTVKLSIWRRDKYICHYCLRKLDDTTATIDHIKGKQYGGTNDKGNLITSCEPCNKEKGRKTEFKIYEKS